MKKTIIIIGLCMILLIFLTTFTTATPIINETFEDNNASRWTTCPDIGTNIESTSPIAGNYSLKTTTTSTAWTGAYRNFTVTSTNFTANFITNGSAERPLIIFRDSSDESCTNTNRHLIMCYLGEWKYVDGGSYTNLGYKCNFTENYNFSIFFYPSGGEMKASYKINGLGLLNGTAPEGTTNDISSIQIGNRLDGNNDYWDNICLCPGNWNETCCEASPTSTREITLHNPANNKWTNEAQPMFNFTAVSILSANLNCSLLYGGSKVWNASGISNNTDYNFTPPAPLSEGTNTWYINCTDATGEYKSTQTRTLTIDLTNPTINSFNVLPSTIYTNTPAYSNVTAYDNLGTIQANLTCDVDGTSVLNQTNVTLTNNTEHQFNTIGTGNYTKGQTISCNVTVWDDASRTATSNSFTVVSDSPATAPSLTGIPTTLYAGINISLNASGSTDNDSDTIIYYSYMAYNINDGRALLNLTNSTGKSNQEIDVYITHSDIGDTINFTAFAVTTSLNGTNITKNRTITPLTIIVYAHDAETGNKIENFTVNITYEANVSYGFNGTQEDSWIDYNATTNYSTHLISGANTTYRILLNATSGARNYSYYNSTHYFNASGIPGTNITFNLSIPPADALNISFWDEETELLMNGKNVNFTLISTANASKYWTTSGVKWITDLTRGIEYEIRYFSDGYNTRSYFVNITATTQTVNLYLINSTNSSLTTATIYDYDGDLIEGATVGALRYYVSCNCYMLVEMSKTSGEGIAGLWLKKDTAYYKFQVEYNDTIVYLSSATRIFDSSLTITVNLGTPVLKDFFKFYTVTYRLNFTNSTNNFNFYFSDSKNHVTKGCLQVYLITPLQETLYNSSCNSSSSALLFVGINNATDTTYKAIGWVSINGTNYVLETATHTFSTIVAVFGTTGLFLTLIVLLVISFVGVYNPAVMFMLEAVAIIFTRIVGLHSLDWAVVGGIAAVCVLLTYIVTRET